MPQIDRRDSLPPYLQIAGHLAELILAGHYAPGGRLPSIAQLVEQWTDQLGRHVARMTARKALHVLVDDGAAYIVSGYGTFVMDDKHRTARLARALRAGLARW